MDLVVSIVLIILGWMLTSACFMMTYGVTGDEGKIERIMIGIICFPWLICFIIAGLIDAFIGICEKKNKSENDK